MRYTNLANRYLGAHGSDSVGSERAQAKIKLYLLTSDQTLSSVHGDGSDDVFSEVLSDLENQTGLASGDIQSVQDFREAIFELEKSNNKSMQGGCVAQRMLPTQQQPQVRIPALH